MKDPDTCNIVLKKKKKTENDNLGKCRRVSKHCYRRQQSPDSFQWKTIIRAQLKQQLHISKRSLANRIKRMQNDIDYFHSNLSRRITGSRTQEKPI